MPDYSKAFERNETLITAAENAWQARRSLRPKTPPRKKRTK